MSDVLNKYKAFWRSKTTVVQAATSYAAQEKAAKFFKAKKQYEVHVILCEKDGETVLQSTCQ